MSNRRQFGKYDEIKKVGILGHQKIGVKICPAKASDAAFIGQLSEKVFNIYGPYKDIISHWFELDLTTTLVALMDSRPAGFAMIGHLSHDRTIQHVSELLAIAVEQGTRLMGIGGTLIREIERKAAELEVNRLFLHTATENLSARRLFTRNGYRPCETKIRFYPEGQNALMMTKEIVRDVHGQRINLSF